VARRCQRISLLTSAQLHIASWRTNGSRPFCATAAAPVGILRLLFQAWRPSSISFTASMSRSAASSRLMRQQRDGRLRKWATISPGRVCQSSTRGVSALILQRQSGSIIPRLIAIASASRRPIFPARSGMLLLKRSPSGGRRTSAGGLRTDVTVSMLSAFSTSSGCRAARWRVSSRWRMFETCASPKGHVQIRGAERSHRQTQASPVGCEQQAKLNDWAADLS